MAQLFGNYLSTQIAIAFSPAATLITVVDSTGFPAPAGVDYFYATIVDYASWQTNASPPAQREIVKVTNITGNVWTVVRGIDGTAAQNWAQTSRIELRACAQTLRDVQSGTSVGALLIVNNLADVASASTALSNLAYLSTGTGAVARSATAKLRDRLSVKDFGAVGNGVVDDTTAIQAAITAAGTAGGGEVYIPTGVYKISATLTIGNGTNTTDSTYQGVSFIGQSRGANADEVAPVGSYEGPASIVWAGANHGTMIRIDGPIGGVNVSDLHLDCANLADTAIYCLHAFGSTFTNLIAQSYNGFAYRVEARGIVSLVNCQHNTWINVMCSVPNLGNAAQGLQLGQVAPAATALDVSRQQFINCLFTRAGDSAANASAQYAYADACTFIGTIFTSEGGALGTGIKVVVPPLFTAFPAAVHHFNCPIVGGVSGGAGWAGVVGLGFFPYNVSDGEPVPTGAFASGFTDGVGMPWFGTNITIATLGKTFAGDFSNATLLSRNMFQDKTVNASSRLGVKPNGTSLVAQVIAYNNSDPTNANQAQISASSTSCTVGGNVNGGGALIIFDVTNGASSGIRLDIAANTAILKGHAERFDAIAATGPITVANNVVFVDATAGSVVITLPAANAWATAAATVGQRLRIIRTDKSGNTVTIQRAGADTIDDAATSFTMAILSNVPTDGHTCELQSNNSNHWYRY